MAFAQLFAALLALLAIGSACEQSVGLRGGSFVFQRIVLGQVVLLLWFELRSLTVRWLHLPGISSAELWLLALSAALFLARAFFRQRKSNGDTSTAFRSPRSWGPLAFWILSALLGAWALRAHFESLSPPSSDLEFQAILARHFADHGAVVFTQSPDAASPLWYPSGFPSLNVLFILLTRLEPAQLVSIQPGLQATLAIGLVAELSFLWRKASAGAVALAALLTLLGQLVFALSINADHPTLHSPARLSHTALLILPLVLALRLDGADSQKRAQPLWWLTLGFCAAFALSLNPAHALVAIPWLLAALFIAHRFGRVRFSRPGLAALFAVVAAALVLANDAWLHGLFAPAAINGAALQVEQASSAHLKLWAALGAGLRFALNSSALFILPPGCVLGGACSLAIDPLRAWIPAAMLLAALCSIGLRRRASMGLRRRASTALPTAPGAPARTPFADLSLLLVALLWLSLFLAGTCAQLAPNASAIGPVLFQRYASEGLLAAMPLALFLLCAVGLTWSASLFDGLASRWRIRAPGELLTLGAALLGAGMLSLFLPAWSDAIADQLSAIAEPEPSSLGPMDAADIAFAKRVAARVPPDARVLLPGLTLKMNPWETWHFAMAGARALPLYTRARFAFHLDLGGPEFNAEEYQRRVCRTLDLPWLLDHGVQFILLTPEARRRSCVHQPELAARWLEPIESDADGRVLLRIRGELRSQFERAPVLDIPLEKPLARETGSGLVSEVWKAGPDGVRGFVCDRGVDTPVTLSVELSLLPTDGTALPRSKIRELHAAGAPVESIAARCGGPAHAFAFAPSLAPPGHYRTRLVALAADGSEARVLADGFTLDVSP